MKNYYYFVRSLSEATQETVVYKVAVGETDKDFVRFCLVREYARECGCYFRKVSVTSDKAIRQLDKSLFGAKFCPMLRVRTAKISIENLYRAIIDDSFSLMESSLVHPKGTFFVRKYIDSDFFFSQNKKKRKKGVPTVPRKNLKYTDAEEAISVAISCAVLVLVFLLGGLIDHFQNF